MKFHAIVLLVALEGASAFHASIPQSQVSSSALFAGKSRKARRQMEAEKEARGRSKQFYDAIEDAQGKKKKKKKKDKKEPTPFDEDDTRRAAIINDAQQRMDQRPELSTMVVDEETGIEVVQQGQSVLDVVTRKAVKLSDMGPQYRLAQMFPGVPPDTRDKYRLDWKTVQVAEVVDKLKAVSTVKLEDGTQGIPPVPSVANSAIDFILANRDYLGVNMKQTLGRLTMKASSEGKDKEAKELNKLWKNYLTIENHISAPFRQIMQDAEGRVGPNFGNLDLKKFCRGELYERVGNYIVLKGMVAHWEKKVVDADFIEKNPPTKENNVSIMARGDPKRYLPDPPILYTLKECTQVCAMAQQMCKAFVEDEELFGDLPPEVVFLEESLKIQGGTALRKYMIDEFCPARGITPAALIEGMRRFYEQLSNMQIDPYGDLTNKLGDLSRAMAVGTDDARDPYAAYAASVNPGDPGFFQTYTFDHPKRSLVRFLDNSYPSARDEDLWGGETELELQSEGDGGLDFGGLFNFGGDAPAVDKDLRSEPSNIVVEETYTVPEERSLDRPHMMGWFERLNAREGEKVRLGEMPSGSVVEGDA